MKLNAAWLKDLLNGTLPGEAAQLKMAPVFRGVTEGSSGLLEAAVVFLIFENDGMLHSLFIRRNEYPGPHSAQVSLPGGMKDPGDRTLEDTAYRELAEETGIYGVKIHRLGKLTPLSIPVSRTMVTPFVAWAEGKPSFSPDIREVQYLITPALAHLLDDASIEEEWMEKDGARFLVPYFRCGKDKIWGATAMMISELKELIYSVRPLPEL